jgi:hypothetical protein
MYAILGGCYDFQILWSVVVLITIHMIHEHLIVDLTVEHQSYCAVG